MPLFSQKAFRANVGADSTHFCCLYPQIVARSQEQEREAKLRHGQDSKEWHAAAQGLATALATRAALLKIEVALGLP